MKLNFKILTLLIAILCIGCDDDTVLEQTSPDGIILTEPGIGIMVISQENSNNQAINITWNDYSNSNATYNIDIATDDLFENTLNIGSTEQNNFTLTQQEVNSAMATLNSEPFNENTAYLRVSANSMMSNTVSFVVVNIQDAPVLISTQNEQSYTLLSENASDEVFETQWRFLNDANLTITYDIEVAISGTEFAVIESLGSVDNANSLSVATSALNSAAVALGIEPEVEGTLDMRVKATYTDASNESVEEYSNIVTFSVTPYMVDTGINCDLDQLWLVGAAVVDAGWGWDTPVALPCTGNGVYSGNVNFQSTEGSNNFRFFTEEGNWGSGQNYPFYANDGYTIDTNFEDAMDGDNNFAYVGVDGQQFLTVDTVNKTITIGGDGTPNCELDQLWLVGAGVPDAGWGWDSPVALPCTGNGTYSGNVTFANDAFRFFSTEGDWGSGTNYPTYVSNGYTIDTNFEDAMDNDNNFRFVGTPGSYFLTVNTINKTITIGDAGNTVNCELDQLWLVGAGVPDAGWGWDSPVALPCTGNGVYSGSVTFANDAFRFFSTEGDWGSGTNYPTYISNGYTIDNNFEDAMDNDNNFRFIGTPGTYTLTVDTNNLSITVQ